MICSEATGVRSSCDAVATKERRACSCSRSRVCMNAKVRLRSPISSRPDSGRNSATGPTWATRSAVSRRRRMRRAVRPAITTPASTATSRPAAAASRKARRTTPVAAWTSCKGRRAATTKRTPSAFAGTAESASASDPSPLTRSEVFRVRNAIRAAANGSSGSRSVLTSTRPAESRTATSAPVRRSGFAAASSRLSPTRNAEAGSDVKPPISAWTSEVSDSRPASRRRSSSGENRAIAATPRVRALTKARIATTRSRSPKRTVRARRPGIRRLAP